MLIDKIRMDFVSGAGGSGSVNFHKSGKPDGGDGGHGGDVYLIGDRNVYDFRTLSNKKKLEAGDGERGAYNKRTGANGDDLVVSVPLTTKVYDLEGRLITVIEKHGQKVLLLKGGAGGKGNYYFRKGQLSTLKKYTPGKKGLRIQTFLELELNSDIVFIGLPNAGKSSMLNVITNTNVKVANYPFTTLVPYIGTMDKIKLMDLPGLIEGTSKGKGLGSGFKKHVRNSRAVAHFVSFENENIKEDYEVIRRELSEIEPSLLDKPEILVLSKSDNLPEQEISKKIKEAKKFHKDVIPVSIINDEQIKQLKQQFEEILGKRSS